jgi:cell division protein FtsL
MLKRGKESKKRRAPDPGAAKWTSFRLTDSQSEDAAPFVSVIIIVTTLFMVVFCKMELRRIGYQVLKLSRVERQMHDRERQQMIQLAKITQPERVQQVAQNRLTLKRAEAGQIIQMTERGIALKE